MATFELLAEADRLGAALAVAWCVGAVMRSVVARTLPATRLTRAADGVSPGPIGLVGSVQRRAARLADRRRAGRRTPMHAAHVAAWCDALSRQLRAGDTLRAALEQSLPDDRTLRARTDPLRRSLTHGVTVAEAVASATPTGASTGTNDPHLELLCSVIAATADFGGAAAAPIDRVGATLRLRSADSQEREAQSAQARLSAHVLTVVPLGVLALLVGTDADVRHFAASGLGSMIITAGMALNLSGWWWMHRVVTGGPS